MQNPATTGGVDDRRHLAQDLLNAMAGQDGRQHPAGLREMASRVLGFAAADAAIAVAPDLLPEQAAVIATLDNEFGPDFLALHFDLSAAGEEHPPAYVTNSRIQAANALLQQYAGGERLPLLLFTLPDNSGLQFVTGDPAPGHRYRLQQVRRFTAWWHSPNRTALECLEKIGQAIIHGGNPERAFREGFSVQPVTAEFFAHYKQVYDDTVRWLSTVAQRPDAEQFTQTLFNRLLFIHFISRKGWLTFNGSPDYLNALWADYQ